VRLIRRRCSIENGSALRFWGADLSVFPTHIWLCPTAVWIAFVVLALASLSSAYLRLSAFNTALNLAVSGGLVVPLLWLFLTRFTSSEALYG